mgnify:CR=1 FL=1
MSEQYIQKEIVGRAPFRYGISISNLANETNPQYALPEHTEDIMRLLAEANMGVEFQIESPEQMQLSLPQNVRPAFVGVHLPIRDVDFLDQDKRKQSFKYGLQNIQLAHELEADYVVMHMLTKQEWDRIGHRPEFIAEAKKQMEALVKRGKNTGYEGRYLFENLEFPLYPSTASEVLDMNQWRKELGQSQGIQTGICLDLSHLWHTGIMIEINRQKGDVMKPYFEDAYASGVSDFSSYLTPLVEEIVSDLDLIHVTGTHIHQTHLLPRVSTAVSNTDRITLNLQQAMQHVAHALTARNKDAFVINEAHHSTYEEMVNSINSVSDFFAHGRT